MQNRKTHFRTLREIILDWQADGLTGVKESWADFSGRAAARAFACSEGAHKVLVISSGGPIGQLVAAALDTLQRR